MHDEVLPFGERRLAREDGNVNSTNGYNERFLSRSVIPFIGVRLRTV